MKTLKSKIEITGNGLMTNLEANLEIIPNTNQTKDGIRFFIDDKIIVAKTSNVVSTDNFVTLANVETGADKKIALIEHFMASCAICGLDNLDVHFKSAGFEVPILDGSAKKWVEMFNEAGFEGETDFVEPIKESLKIENNNQIITLEPINKKSEITYNVNFNHPDLKDKSITLIQDENLKEIIEARTFGYLKDLETYQKMGLSLGVTIDNTVGLTEDSYTTELRSQYEPVKHKILDIIGDLYLSGKNPLLLNADIKAIQAGHKLHVEFAKLIEKSYN